MRTRSMHRREKEGESEEVRRPSQHKKRKVKPLPFLNLPADLLLQQIFSRLPLLSIYSLRLLSKYWHNQLSSAPFLRAWSRFHEGDRWLVVGDVRYDAPDDMPSDPKLFFYNYCPAPDAGGSSSWLPLPLFCPQQAQLMPRPLLPYIMSYELPADSAGGIVCALARLRDAESDQQRCSARLIRSAQPVLPHWRCGDDDDIRFTLIVFNPLTGHSRALPAPPLNVPFAAGQPMDNVDPFRLEITMLAAPTTSSYRVILCGQDRLGAACYSAGMLTFSSQTSTWTSIAAADPLHFTNITAEMLQDKYGWRRYTNMMLRADLFEWNVTNSVILGCRLSPQISWWQLAGPSRMAAAPQDCSAVPLFFTHRGRVLFAWLMFYGVLATGFTIWELNQPGRSRARKDRMRWVRIAQTPADMQKPIGGCEEEAHGHDAAADYKLVHSGSLVCLLIGNFGDDLRYDAEQDYFVSSLTYDLDRGLWSRLPPLPHSSQLRLLFVGGFSLQPNFAAQV